MKDAIQGLQECNLNGGKIGNCPYKDAILAMLKERESLLGIQQTADAITFLSTGTAQQGEERGLLLGKAFMHEWLEKKLLHRGLLTDEIKTVFNEAKNL